MSDNIVKSQHYIPESLLRHFTFADDKLFEALLADKKIFQTSPNKTMCERFTYEHDQLQPNTIEHFFQNIEDKVAPAIKDLISAIERLKVGLEDISNIRTAFENILPQLLVFYYRSGALLTEFSSMGPEHKIPLLSKKILNEKYINLLSKTITHCYNFALAESTGDFIISDQYIATAALKVKAMYMNISNRHMGTKETIIMIPISSNYYAIYWHSDYSIFLIKDSLNTLSEIHIQQVNQAVMNNSYIKCVGAKEKRLRDALACYQMRSPSQFFVGNDDSKQYGGAIKKKEVFFYDIDAKAYDIFSGHYLIKEYSTAKRNDPCPCGSGLKFKKCHEHIWERVSTVILNIPNKDQHDPYISHDYTPELPIESWGILEQ